MDQIEDIIFEFNFMRKLPNRHPVYIRALHLILELLFSAFKAKEYSTLKDGGLRQNAMRDFEMLLRRVHCSLRDDWIKRFYNSIFGQPYKNCFTYALEDLKVFINPTLFQLHRRYVFRSPYIFI